MITPQHAAEMMHRLQGVIEFAPQCGSTTKKACPTEVLVAARDLLGDMAAELWGEGA